MYLKYLVLDTKLFYALSVNSVSMFQFFICLFVVFVTLVGIGIWAIVAKGSVSKVFLNS